MAETTAAPNQEMKLLIVGSGGVGKSALTVQFTQSTFVEEYDPTIEDTYRKQFVVDDLPVAVNILDTAGQEEYALVREHFIGTGDGFVLVFSVTDSSSFQQVISLYERILRVKDKSWVPCVLVGNKCDLEHDREVDNVDPDMLAQKWNVPYVESSAKTRMNVDAAFSECVRMVRKNMAIVGAQNNTTKPVKQAKKKKSSCTLL